MNRAHHFFDVRQADRDDRDLSLGMRLIATALVCAVLLGAGTLVLRGLRAVEQGAGASLKSAVVYVGAARVARPVRRMSAGSVQGIS